MGYVGAVSAACLARDGHDVIGVDLDLDKLRLIEEGRAPIVEDGIQCLDGGGRRCGSANRDRGRDSCGSSYGCFFRLRWNAIDERNGEQDQTAVLRVAEQIGVGLRDHDRFHVVVVRSTVRLGTVDGQLREILERTSGRRCDVDFALCFQPEFSARRKLDSRLRQPAVHRGGNSLGARGACCWKCSNTFRASSS